MKIFMKEVEPFYSDLETSTMNQLGMFLQSLTGNETFEFPDGVRPKSVMFFAIAVKNKHLHRSKAEGWLLSVNYDSFGMLKKSKGSDRALQEVKIGRIKVELGGDLASPLISAEKVSSP